MEKRIELDYSKVLPFVDEGEIDCLSQFVKTAHDMLHNGTGAGSDYTGWVELPLNYDRDEFDRIKKCAEKIRSDSEVLIVIGIGGSYLGARAVIEALNDSFYNYLPADKRKGPLVLFAGNSLSGTYLSGLLQAIEGKDVSLNVVSKSGTTTEPAIAFRIFKSYLEKKYGKKEAAGRIYVTTDRARGALKKMADAEGYRTFVIPDDVGGRYSVLTAVGLLPIAASGADIDALMRGAADAYGRYLEDNLKLNQAYQYAALRNILYRKGKTSEILVNYEPSLHYISEWWKQLFGESEGKDNKGIFPASVDFTTDLHSMGQYIQQGRRNIFETVVNVEDPASDMTIPDDPQNSDGLNFLSGKSMNFVSRKAFQGTLIAHMDGDVPNIVVNIPSPDEYNLGYLIYFFEKACGISGYLLGINPFDQPGVEKYKRNMFALLGKPGYEKKKEEIEKRL